MSRKDMAADYEALGREAILTLTKALRGGFDFESERDRFRISQASKALASWSRYQQTQSNREQMRLTMTAVIADDQRGPKFLDALRITMPEHSVLRRLSSGAEEGDDE